MKATIKTTRRLSCLDKKRYLCKCCNRKRLKTFPLMPGGNKKTVVQKCAHGKQQQ